MHLERRFIAQVTKLSCCKCTHCRDEYFSFSLCTLYTVWTMELCVYRIPHALHDKPWAKHAWTTTCPHHFYCQWYQFMFSSFAIQFTLLKRVLCVFSTVSMSMLLVTTSNFILKLACVSKTAERREDFYLLISFWFSMSKSFVVCVCYYSNYGNWSMIRHRQLLLVSLTVLSMFALIEPMLVSAKLIETTLFDSFYYYLFFRYNISIHSSIRF